MKRLKEGVLRSRGRLFLLILLMAMILPLVVGNAFANPPAPIPKTGQTTCYNTSGTAIPCANTGQDGDKQAGVAWPNPRFTDNNNGTVTDNLTGLVWLKNANCFGAKTWAEALNAANTLQHGQCGLSDSSTAGEWRLPNVNELESLIHAGQANSAIWLNTQGFSNVQSNWYWSSTTYAYDTAYAWIVVVWDGGVGYDDKGNNGYVWPVRSGSGGSFYNLVISKSGTGIGTVTSSPSGINCGTTCSASFSSDTIVTLTATAASGSVFGGWSGDCSGTSSTCTVTMNNDKNVTAIFNSSYGTVREPIYRFYNSITGGHFFTDNPDERNRVISSLPDFRLESDNAFYIYRTQQSGTNPVYRLYNPYGSSHYYTISEADKNAKVAMGYIFEFIGFYAYSTQVSGTKPVYYFNRPASTNNGREAWFYTIWETEKELIIRTLPMWNYMGIAFYAFETN